MTDKDTIRNLEEKIRRLQQESKQAIEVIKRLEDRIESLYTYDDVLSHEQAEYLESILKGDKI